MTHPRIAVLCGGVGAARLLRALIRVVDPTTVSAIVNVADDIVLHGLSVSPDLDTVTYTLADAIDPDRGWGLYGETWRAMESISRYGDGTSDWFSLGDQDLATHMYRSGRLALGASLTEVTAEIATAWDVGVHVLPVTNDRVSTWVTLADSGTEIPFQEYFVGHRHSVAISAVRFDGIAAARISADCAAAIADAEIIIVAPSNPIVSIAPVISIPGVVEALDASPAPVVAVSPIIAGAALKGPAASMLHQLGHEPSVVGVARLWRDIADILLIDETDASAAGEVASQGLVPFVTDTIMATPQRGERLARAILSASRLVSNS